MGLRMAIRRKHTHGSPFIRLTRRQPDQGNSRSRAPLPGDAGHFVRGSAGVSMPAIPPLRGTSVEKISRLRGRVPKTHAPDEHEMRRILSSHGRDREVTRFTVAEQRPQSCSVACVKRWSCRVRESGTEGERRQASDDRKRRGFGRSEWCRVFAVIPCFVGLRETRNRSLATRRA